jgi:hypothetical protein
MVVYLPLLNVLRLTTFLRQTPQSDEPGLRTEYNFPLLVRRERETKHRHQLWKIEWLPSPLDNCLRNVFYHNPGFLFVLSFALINFARSSGCWMIRSVSFLVKRSE